MGLSARPRESPEAAPAITGAPRPPHAQALTCQGQWGLVQMLGCIPKAVQLGLLTHCIPRSSALNYRNTGTRQGHQRLLNPFYLPSTSSWSAVCFPPTTCKKAQLIVSMNREYPEVQRGKATPPKLHSCKSWDCTPQWPPWAGTGTRLQEKV